mgnify:CR=1 FL=1|tara:strand:+ start:5645 stop:7195 length:1551 start_codon:yes stop_codon:yes gene_type:complete
MKSINQKISIGNLLEIENFLKNNKAIIINKTSVYEEYAILKDGALTSNGYFDLIQIPYLRFYAGKFLKSIRLKLHLTQREFSRRYNFSKSALAHWEGNRCAISLKTLIKIARDTLFTKEDIYKSIREKRIFTKKKVNLSFKYLDFIEILPYISIMSKNVLIIKQTGKRYVNKISKLFNINIYHLTNKQFVIRNKDLQNFLVTFFNIRLILKFDLPQTDFVKNLESIDLRKAMICPLLQTDGSGNFHKRKNLYSISFKNICKELHHILLDSIYLSYNKFLPSSYLLKDNNDNKYTECYVTRYASKDFQPVYKDLIKLCGNFKTSKYHSQSIEDYKKEAKPHLFYLLNAEKAEKIAALRIWASTEGAIIPMRRNKGGLIIPKLQISCANKELLFQLEKVVRSIGLHFSIRNERGNGYKCLYNMAVSCTLSFLKLGGFIDGVRISKNSKYYEGVHKQHIVYATLEHMVRERKDSSLRKLPMSNVHKSIRKVAENREFKKLDYYIRFFSQNDKVQKCLNY